MIEMTITNSAQVITHLEKKVVSQQQNEVINQHLSEVEKEEHEKLAEQYNLEIRKVCTLKS